MITEKLDVKEINHGLFSLLEKIADYMKSAEIKNDSFSYGRCSAALFSLYYGHHFGDEQHLNRGIQLIEEVIENIANGNSSFSGCELYSGLAGFTVSINNLHKAELLDIDMKQFAPVEQLLFDWSMEQLQVKNTDFFSGVSGSLNYFINRLDSTDGQGPDFDRIVGYINAINETLEKQFFVADNNQTFLYNNYYINVNKEKEGAVNYGIAHGISSIILNFLLLKDKGLLKESLKQKLDELIQSILYLRNTFKPVPPYYFVSQYNVYDKSVDFQNRIGWCYSDLNMIHLLAMDQKISNHKKHANLISECSTRVLSRVDFKENRLEDPFFCHGYSGVAEYYKVLFNLTKESVLLDGYNWALQKTLNCYNENVQPAKDKSRHSFFYGDLGVGFVLMSALKPACNTWNEIVLL